MNHVYLGGCVSIEVVEIPLDDLVERLVLSFMDYMANILRAGQKATNCVLISKAL